jgi:hypothetical protein
MRTADRLDSPGTIMEGAGLDSKWQSPYKATATPHAYKVERTSTNKAQPSYPIGYLLLWRIKQDHGVELAPPPPWTAREMGLSSLNP